MPTDEGPNFEIRALIAVALSLGVLIGYQLLFAPPPGTGAGPDTGAAAESGPTETDKPSTERGAAGESAAAATDGSAAGVGDATALPTPSPDSAVSADAPERAVVESARYRLVVTNVGARIASLELKDYESNLGGPLELVVADFAEQGHLPLQLLSPDDPEAAAVANGALFEMSVTGGRSAGRTRIVEGDPVTITWRWSDGRGAAVTKSLTIPPDGYMLELGVEAELGGVPTYVTFGPGLVEGADASTAGMYLVRGAILLSGGELEHWDDGDLEEPVRNTQPLQWGGVESAYFTTLFVTAGDVARVYMDALPVPQPEGAAESKTGAAAGEPQPGGEEEAPVPGSGARFALAVPGSGLRLPVYMGPKQVDILGAHGFQLEEAVDFGMFGFVAYPLLVGLKWLQSYVVNYGVAIIVLTVLIRILFLPLTQKSFKSMRKMQALQPEMQKIKNRYKGAKDLEQRQKMNEEVMGLYKEHGVSPLGGCLPMLVQMPVLFAFYACLSVAIEIRHAPLMLWIQDLSRADPYYVLPILMGISMYGQQRMSPTTADPAQARMFRLMPVLFTFFFLNLPSGLVLYWLVNNLLGIAQQVWITRQMSASDEATAGTDGTSKGRGGKGKRKKRGKKR